MSVVVVYTWLVRSYAHQYEIRDLLDKVPLKVANPCVADKLYFDLVEHPKYGTIHVSMDPFGLVSFRVETDGGDIEAFSKSFAADVEDLFVEKIMKSIQKVSYTQIKDDIMPLSFHRVILSKTYRPSAGVEVKAGGVSLYFDGQKLYSPDFPLFIFGSEDIGLLDAASYYSYAIVAGRYISRMVSIMSDLYKKADDIVKDIDRMNDDSSNIREQMTSLKMTIIKTDFVRRQCSERYGKISQAIKNFEYKEHYFSGENFSGDSKAIAQTLRIDRVFERLKCDTEYLIPLWRDVLIKNLENLSFAVNARISFQESLESRKEQKEVRLLRYITVLGLSAAVVKLGEMKSLDMSGLVLNGLLVILLGVVIILTVEYLSGELLLKRRNIVCVPLPDKPRQ